MSFGIKITPLDKIFSLYIRERAAWTCERCKKRFVPPTNGLQNSHFIGRSNQIVRHDEENCDALCSGCHSHFEQNPHEYHEWKLTRLGHDRYWALILRSKGVRKEPKRIWEPLLLKEIRAKYDALIRANRY